MRGMISIGVSFGVAGILASLPDIALARRRVKKVTEVPISVTVASEAQLARRQINTVNDLNRIAPSLESRPRPARMWLAGRNMAVS